MRDAYRHRLVLSYQALAEEVTADHVLDAVLAVLAPPQIDLGRAATAGSADVKGLIAAAGRERTPARPGPGAVTAESLEALELAIARRVDGLLAGDYRSAFAGLGTELQQVRPYEPGDDVRRIDWNVTARTGAARTCASSSPSACSSPGSCSTPPHRWTSAPPSGGRPTSPKALRSRSAMRRRAAATGSGSSRSGRRTRDGAGRGRAGADCC